MSIYHLHIPRTSGIYVKQNILPHLITNKIKHFVSNRTFIDIKKIEESKFVGGHFGLMPLDYMNDPEIFCIIRNPIERFISYFKYTSGFMKDKNQIYEKLENWLYGDQSKIQSNQQSKFLTGSINIEKFNENINFFQHSVNSGWYLENYSLKIDDILKNIDNFYCYTLENQNLFLEDLNKSLNKHFRFTTFKNNYKANFSKNIDLKISNKNFDRIIEMNEIDMKVYEYVQKNKKRY